MFMFIDMYVKLLILLLKVKGMTNTFPKKYSHFTNFKVFINFVGLVSLT